ncbi:Hypothetical predicted protein [Marmota monax]|uniref:Ig-like domain-containing protein n=1 Tax=Marmota monax TaxID=9995 RepID=A0A5E4BA73_MARMO|nr:hypothetical protein GHT09_000586 [Marmota monax]VTJ66513.1 Hypothetical predicted protein [Marmota monax]
MAFTTELQVSALIPISLPSSKDMEGRCSRSLLCCLASLLLLVQLSTVPGINAENMELRWFRTTFSQAVFIYWNQQEQTEELMADYRGWTSLVSKFLTQGQAAVHIHKVQVSDNGMYTCFFRHGGFSEKADLELKVAGMGADPQGHIEGPEEDGVRVMCKASGWFPKPQVQWRDLCGNKFLALSEDQTQDSEELFSVEATLVVSAASHSQQSYGKGLASLSVLVSWVCP